MWVKNAQGRTMMWDGVKEDLIYDLVQQEPRKPSPKRMSRLDLRTDSGKKPTGANARMLTAATWSNGKSKTMEVNQEWNREQLHEELRRHWASKHKKSEVVARKNGVQQVAFGIGSECTYELRISPGVYGGGVTDREDHRTSLVQTDN
jgi:hypothetical protein